MARANSMRILQLLIFGAVAVGHLGGCAPDPVAEIPLPGPIADPWLELPAQPGPWNVLLLTLDTTRRDRLGCYGCDKPLTPHLDRLAAEGILFEQAVASAPVTLPSHATILTGLDPQEHGVRNNGTFVLPANQTTLTEVLQAAGYTTSATIGAFPVAAEFGLDQGFDLYDDQFPVANRVREWQTIQRTADEVTALATAWIGAHVEKHPAVPFFHWAHYFDPHFPYEPPQEHCGAWSNYDGEIAFMDAQIGLLLDALAAEDLRANTWIVVVGDHGESLNEHGEDTHGIFLYGATTRVPLIVVPPTSWKGLAAQKLRGERIAAVVGLRNIAPTLLNALGMERTALPACGASLLPLIAGESPGPRVVYMEAMIPRYDYGWCELRGVRTERWSYVRAPEPELYDLGSDPLELTNLALKQPNVTARLEIWCAHFATDSQGPAMQAPSPETIAKLRSLGYLAGNSVAEPVEDCRDPKEMMRVFCGINNARAALGLGQPKDAYRLLREVLNEDPENPEANRVMGTVALRLGNAEVAVSTHEHLLQRFPGNAEFQLNLARSYLLALEARKAEELFRILLEEDPQNQAALNLYPRALALDQRQDEARQFLKHREATDADPSIAQGVRATFEWGQGNREDAYQLAQMVLTADADNATAHALVGEWLWEQSHARAKDGDVAAAESLLVRGCTHVDRALELNPLESLAAFRKGWSLRQKGDVNGALELYERALAENPTMVLAHVNLGNLLREMNRLPEALRHYEYVRSLGYEEVNMYISYGVTLAMMNRTAEAAEVWERALALNPDPQTAAGIQRNLQQLRGR